MNYRIFSLSDNSLTIEFDDKISVEINDRVLALADFIQKNSFIGFLENVPAYSSLTVFYDVVKVRNNFSHFETAFETVGEFVEKALGSLPETQKTISRLRKIPVCFDEEFAPDLKFIATRNNLAPNEVVEIFLAKTYRVFMLGFLPGFAYMGEVDARIATPRKEKPRLKIAPGSVGIAGNQTGIYPLESPGGWQIIGKTPLKLFTPDANSPTLLNVSDSIKFVEITKKDFSEWRF